VSAEDHAEMVKEIAEVASDTLSERECEFIEDMGGRRTFTVRQAAWIERIYEKVCDSPF